MTYRKHRAHAALTVLLTAIAGCGEGDVASVTSTIQNAASQGLNQATQTASQALQQTETAVGETLALKGDIAFTLESAQKTDACYVRFVEARGGRSAVLQLQSYRSADQEEFPSVYVRAIVPSGTLAELAGQTIAADMFVMTQATGPVWFSRTAPIKLKIKSIVDKSVSAEITEGQLFNTSNGQDVPIQGSFNGVLD
jgi:hypothetical protein